MAIYGRAIVDGFRSQPTTADPRNEEELALALTMTVSDSLRKPRG